MQVPKLLADVVVMFFVLNGTVKPPFARAAMIMALGTA